MVGIGLMHNSDGAISARGVDGLGIGVVGNSVHAFADGDSGDDFAIGGVHDGEDFAAAADEEAIVFCIDGEAGGRLASHDGPLVFDSERLRIVVDDFGFFFEVDESVAFAVDDGGFCAAAEIHLADHFLFLRIDGGDDLAVSVADEDAVELGVIEDEVGVVRDLDGLQRLEGVGVEDGDGGVAAVGDESDVLFGNDGDAMDAGSGLHGAEFFAAVGVEDVDLCAVRDVQAVGGRVEDDVVESAVAGDGIVFGDLIAGCVGGKAGRGEGKHERNAQESGSHGVPLMYGGVKRNRIVHG